jgi:hypothetical protein
MPHIAPAPEDKEYEKTLAYCADMQPLTRRVPVSPSNPVLVYRRMTAGLDDLAATASSFLQARQGALRCLVVLVAVYAALITVPDPPHPLGTGLDPSWVLGVNMAHAQHLIAGRDIIFTTGPWGYLATPDRVSGAPVAAFIYRIGLYLIWAFALIRLAVAVRSKVVALTTVSVLALAVLSQQSGEIPALKASIMCG